jgi:hypothetical protein
VAPIALYPDQLLSEILMASTYPLEVVDAARWVLVPANAQLQGDPLNAALAQEDWDPSVKSLVPFPQVLKQMNSQLDWTQALGNVFLAQQADVMNSVQRLRAEAVAAGTLKSTPQETVATQGQIITIAPPNPQTVYVPYYNPTVAYGSWGYPGYPPDYFPPPPGYVDGSGLYFGAGIGIVSALWGWDSWDWSDHSINVDAGRYNQLDNYSIAHDNRPAVSGKTWQHDSFHRRGVPYRDAATRAKFQPATAATAGARRNFRGFDAASTAAASTAAASAARGGRATGTERQRGGALAARPTAPAAASAALPRAATEQASSAATRRAPATMGGIAPRAAAQRPVAAAFASFGKRADVQAAAQRGHASRQTVAAARPAARVAARPAARAAAPVARAAAPAARPAARAAPAKSASAAPKR